MGCGAITSPNPTPLPSDPERPRRPQPQVDNVENFVVVWLDTSIGNNTDTPKSKDQLQQLVNVVKIFTHPEKCLTFINLTKDEKIFLIVSCAFGEHFVPVVQDVTQIDSIYVFCLEKGKHKHWTSDLPEVRGLYTSINRLCEQLEKDTKKSDRDLIGFEVVERSSIATMTEMNQQEALFMYDQLFQEIVLTMREKDMTDMYEFCRTHYRSNREELKFLVELQRNYSNHSPIWWYGRESFLYRILNKALRTHQYDTLYALRIFIRHLHKQIIKQQTKNEYKTMALYRGQGMEKVDFERIRANEGGLMSISNFLSTSANREIALEFAREALKDRKKISVLMEFKVDKNIPVPFTNVSQQNIYEKEKEWLFPMGSIFRIGSVKRLTDGIWFISLKLTLDNDEQLTVLREYFKTSLEDNNSCLNFARLMHQLAAWKQAEYFYLMSLETETILQRRSVIYNELGLVKSELKQYNEALQYYQQSLQLKQEQQDVDEKDLASTYNNMGTLYYKQKKIKLAIEIFQKASEVYNNSSKNNQEFLATLYNNIATILNNQGKYEEALENNEKCLNIRINSLPSIHPSLAITYSSISNTLHHLHDLEQALEYAQKAVNIDIQALPPNHPQTQLHMENLEVIKQELDK